MTKKMANQNYRVSLSVLISFALILLAFTITVPVGAESVIPDYHHINLAMVNGGERYFKCDGGGLNALHISGDPSDYFGSLIASDSQSGTFYLTDTGGRGSDDVGILLIAVKGDVPDDFKVHIRGSGYSWTPSEVPNQVPTVYSYVDGAVDETFTKSDFTYGPQNWRPGPVKYPIYDHQDLSDTSEQFHLMFIDLHAGIIGQNSGIDASTLVDKGALKVDYSFENLTTFAAFDAYAWCLSTSQGMGITWLNRLSTTGSSGVTVKGPEPTPTTEPTTPAETPNTTVSVTPTETLTTIETTLNVTPTVTINQTTPATTITVTSTTAVPSTVMPLTTATTTSTATSTQPVSTATALPVTAGTTTGVTVSETTVQASLTTAPSATATIRPEPSVTVPALSTLFPSRIQTSAPAQVVTGASQVQSPASGAGTVVPGASSAQATVTAQGVQTVASSATAVPATVSSGYTQTIATQSASQSTSNSAGGPVSTGDSSSGLSSDDYTGVGGTVGTTATPVPTTATTAPTQSAAPTPSPTLVNTSTPTMTTPTPPFIDTGNQNEYSPISLSGSSGAASSRDRSSSQNFLSTIQSTIDRLSSSDLSLLLLIGAVLLFALLVFAGLIIMVLLLLLLVIGLLYLRQRKNLRKDLQNKD